jgi:CRP/FNR family transcriptional regulator, cyclic AMP receptor protein
MENTLRMTMNELYEALSDNVRQHLQNCEDCVSVKSGTRLISKGLPLEHLIIINGGTVEISLAGDSRSVTLGIAKKGKVLGLRPLISGDPPEIDAVCTEECNITCVPRDEFLRLLNEHPQIYLAVAKVLSTDLKAAQEARRALMS